MKLSNDVVDIKRVTTTSQCILSSMLTEDCLSHLVSFLDCVDLYLLEDAFVIMTATTTAATTNTVSQKNFVKVLRRVTRIQWDALQEMDSNNNSNSNININSSDTNVPNQDRQLSHPLWRPPAKTSGIYERMMVIAEKNLMAMYDNEDGPSKKNSLSISRVLGRDYGYHYKLAKELTRIACHEIYDYSQTSSCFVSENGAQMMRIPMKKKEQAELQPQPQQQQWKEDPLYSQFTSWRGLNLLEDRQFTMRENQKTFVYVYISVLNDGGTNNIHPGEGFDKPFGKI